MAEGIINGRAAEEHSLGGKKKAAVLREKEEEGDA